MRVWGLAPALLSLALLAHAEETRTLEIENGGTIRYTLIAHPENAHVAEDTGTSALSTAKRVTRYLAEGRIEEASLLSNAPKARYERLREAFAGWSAADFERTYGRYFDPENRIVGEAAIGAHRLLMWHLKDTDHLTGFFLVEIEGRFLLDDQPSDARLKLRHVLEASRAAAGK